MERVLLKNKNGYMITAYFKDGMLQCDGYEDWTQPITWKGFIRLQDLANGAPTKDSGLHLQRVSGSAFVIMFQKKPLKNILFQSDKEARNYIKMQNPKRKFKEPKENVFVCSRYGTTFEIVELHYR